VLVSTASHIQRVVTYLLSGTQASRYVYAVVDGARSGPIPWKTFFTSPVVKFCNLKLAPKVKSVVYSFGCKESEQISNSHS